jgi:hypothetical protein
MIELSISLAILWVLAYKLLDKYLDRIYPLKEDIDQNRLLRIENELSSIKLTIGRNR